MHLPLFLALATQNAHAEGCAGPSWRSVDAPYEVSATLAAYSHDPDVHAAFSLQGAERDAALRALTESRAEPDRHHQPVGLLHSSLSLALGLELLLPGAEAVAEASFALPPDPTLSLVYEVDRRRVRMLAAGRAALARGDVSGAAALLVRSLELRPGLDHSEPPSDLRTRQELGWTWGLQGRPAGLSTILTLLPEKWEQYGPASPLAIALATLAPDDRVRARQAACFDTRDKACPLDGNLPLVTVAPRCWGAPSTEPGEAAPLAMTPGLSADELTRHTWGFYNPDNWVPLRRKQELVGPLAEALALATRPGSAMPEAGAPLERWTEAALAEETEAALTGQSNPARAAQLEGRLIVLRALIGRTGALAAARARAATDPWLPNRCVVMGLAGAEDEARGDNLSARQSYREAIASGCADDLVRYRLAWLSLRYGEGAQAIAILDSLQRAWLDEDRTPDKFPKLKVVQAELVWMRDCVSRGRCGAVR